MYLAIQYYILYNVTDLTYYTCAFMNCETLPPILNDMIAYSMPCIWRLQFMKLLSALSANVCTLNLHMT